MSDLNTAVSYYVSRLLYEYQQPNAQREIAIIAEQLLLEGLPWSLQNAFTLDSAVGPQLDILGKYVGIPRLIGDPTSLPFFGFVRYSGVGNNPNGFVSYLGNGNNNSVVFFQYNYSQTNATLLTDPAYAFMILWKIALNHCNNTMAGAQALIKAIAPGQMTLTDNLNKTITYNIGNNMPVDSVVLTPYLPRPMGVGITVVVVNNLGTSSGDAIVDGSGNNIILGNA